MRTIFKILSVIFIIIIAYASTACSTSTALCPAYGNDMYVDLDYDKSETKASI